MKFRDPKTGKVFDDICSARKTFCGMWCTSCPLIIAYGTKYGCESWVRKNEEKAARLMGYEALFDDKEIANKKAHWIDNADSYICSACGHEVDNPNKQTCGAGQCMYCGAYMETKEDNMEKQNKPLSEWTLGEVQALCERRNGDGCCDECPFANVIGNCTLRVLPEEWELEEAPRLTEPEIAVMRMMGAKWVSRNINSGVDCAVNCVAVYLWKEKPSSSIGLYFADGGPIATVNDPDLFPSVKPGNLIKLEEAEK